MNWRGFSEKVATVLQADVVELPRQPGLLEAPATDGRTRANAVARIVSAVDASFGRRGDRCGILFHAVLGVLGLGPSCDFLGDFRRPMMWLDTARELLETTGTSLDAIAVWCGLGTPVNFRRATGTTSSG